MSEKKGNWMFKAVFTGNAEPCAVVVRADRSEDALVKAQKYGADHELNSDHILISNIGSWPNAVID